MIADASFYFAAVPAVVLLGLAKGGFAGLVIVGMSLMALVMNPVRAAAIMLPVLIVQDAVGLWAYRRSFDRDALRILVPGALVGAIVAAATAAWVSEATVRIVVGGVAIVFGANHLLGFGPWLSRSPLATGRTAGWFWGAVSGFTSLVSHAGGPPYQVWMLSRRLDRDLFAGTTTWYFAIVNLFKAPFYVGLGQFDAVALKTAAALAPLGVAATVAGVWLVRRTPAGRYFGLIHVLMLLIGAMLVYDGAMTLARTPP